MNPFFSNYLNLYVSTSFFKKHISCPNLPYISAKCNKFLIIVIILNFILLIQIFLLLLGSHTMCKKCLTITSDQCTECNKFSCKWRLDMSMEQIIQEIYNNQDKQVEEYVADLEFFRPNISSEVDFVINMYREYKNFSQVSKKFYFTELKRIHKNFFRMNYANQVQQ